MKNGDEPVVGRLEIGKDVLQTLTESAATHVGRITAIVTGAVRGVTHELGEWASDAFEMRDAAGRAEADAEQGDDLG